MKGRPPRPALPRTVENQEPRADSTSPPRPCSAPWAASSTHSLDPTVSALGVPNVRWGHRDETNGQGGKSVATAGHSVPCLGGDSSYTAQGLGAQDTLVSGAQQSEGAATHRLPAAPRVSNAEDLPRCCRGCGATP